MKQDIKLSNGRIVSHRPYLSANIPNGATEAFMQDGGNMSDSEWVEYCNITMPKPAKKITWDEIKAKT